MIAVYNALLPAARLAARVWARRDEKLAKSLAVQRDAEARLTAHTGLDGPLLWLHSSSAGEYEQARPIAALWSEQRPGWHILHTFTSPSGYDYARRLGEAKRIEYLPEDTPGTSGRVLDALRPGVLIFVKWDVWPNLVVQAHARRIPVVLVDATLREASSRSRWPARALYRELYGRMSLISAVSERDAERFRRVVPEHPRIVVDGDTRFDQVMRRRQEAKRVALPDALARRPEVFTFIAGSTWEPDEARVLPAFAALGNAVGAQPGQTQGRRLRLLLVPHEPSDARLAAIEAHCARLGVASVRLSGLDRPAGGHEEVPSVVLVDRVGVLAEMYGRADVAYVGGAFGAGVHNVMEPAIMGLPVFFGPGYHNSPEAEALVEVGGATVIESPGDLEQGLRSTLADPGACRRIGDQARLYVESNLGASRRCVERIRDILETSRPKEGS